MNNQLDMLSERQRRCVPDVTFELIPICNLVSSQKYQRPVSEQHVRKTVEEFDVAQINPVKVSRRDGLYYIIDGQHTCEAVAHESGSRETPVWCMIFEDFKYEEEARVFAQQQKHVKPLSSYEVFSANIEAGANKQLLLKSIAESYGLAISAKKVQQNYISAVSTIEKIYDNYGQEVLNRTLRLAVSTWEGREGSLSGTILTAISKIVSSYGETLEDEIFIEGVSSLSAKTIIRDGKDKRPGAMGVALVMIEEYNKKTRKRQLDKAGLFGGKKLIRDRAESPKEDNN